IGLLFGLTVIAMVARTILRIGPRSTGRKGGGLAIIYLAALVVLALGWIGLFFGRLIQAAVSRNRESLADASAVQFSRNPTGLRNALVKIGALGVGSAFSDADAEEVAHLLFAQGVPRLFATHPPLVERIRELDPRFQPSEFDEVRKRMNKERAMAGEAADREAQAAPPPRSPLEGAVALEPAIVAGLVANPGEEHVQQAQAMLASLPPSFRQAARDPLRATALFLALAIDREPAARDSQLAYIQHEFGSEFLEVVKQMIAEADRLTPVQRMPALLQVFASLNQLARTERITLLQCLNALLVRESRVSVFAYALRKLAQVQLKDNLDPRRRTAGYLGAAGGRDELQILFSVLATEGSENEQAARQAYDAGMELLLPGIRPPLVKPGHWPPKLDAALTRLDRLQPAVKGVLVKALVTTVAHDQRMTVPESELLRAFCAVLHCPLPPLYAAAR